MQFSDDILVRILVFVLGVCGLMVAKYIRNHKVNDAPMVCPIGFDCHSVVHSDYSKFMGAPVELMGIIYYSILSLIYLAFIFIPSPIPIPLYFFLLLMSLAAFAFSAYLILVQIFILKKGCSWCIVSALICAMIFMVTIFHYSLAAISQLLGK